MQINTFKVKQDVYQPVPTEPSLILQKINVRIAKNLVPLAKIIKFVRHATMMNSWVLIIYATNLASMVLFPTKPL